MRSWPKPSAATCAAPKAPLFRITLTPPGRQQRTDKPLLLRALGISADEFVTPLARVAEIRALRRTASTLLDTYVGHDAGERILAGRIRRGDIEEIHAAIWLSDMRGFTALADRQPPRVLIDL